MLNRDELSAAARNSKAWPYEEAKRIAKRFPEGKAEPVVFETGYGPSGLPHIGTFNEVLRTTMVRRAYEELMGYAPEDGRTRLIAFSDDMDGLRKVPDNVPNGEMLADNLGKPLSRIPNPFDTDDESFAAHNNALLQRFLDQYGFDYEFASAADKYNNGAFDDALRTVLRQNQAILDIMLPTLREERRATYSPILPVSPTTGRVLQVPVEIVDADAGTIRFTDEDGSTVEQSALGGQSKCQWKVDWAMRWVALGVDYEMYGKDLTDSGVQSGRIAKVLGGRKPEGMIYEMFLDANGEKISKSKGNGLSIEEWLTYGSEESLSFYIYREPKKAKNLHLGLVPRAVDEYWQFRGNYDNQPIEKKLGNPVHHVHSGRVPDKTLPLTYGLLLNLVSLPGVQDKDIAWKFVQRYAPESSPESDPELDKLIGLAVNYARDFVVPGLARRAPVGQEVDALKELDEKLAALPADATGEDIQNIVFEVGKNYEFETLRHWFQALYETLLGSSQGPRMGSFIALYGIEETRKLIAEALAA
ncbi:lysine--tRNA ligase [Sphingomicrobium sediminis]|uniref:Lysine--tRNA ligase n=1 Tax=Sphingomicrobium sediminis TaxID=2950949 RepID=A0A9X2EJ03_9SPHN|nr:lysine--tRNA ligase [Sphingomicrobium sediminis]MCM8558395.1 lysine--tRNA ligase [Sphingomicrobium sediminis]